MYPSLPKAEVITEVENRIRDPQFYSKINKNALIRLSRLIINFTDFQINGKYFQQKDGLFIGSPWSPVFANLYIQKLEWDYNYNMHYAP